MKTDKIPRRSERQVLREVLAYLRSCGIDAERQNTGGMYDARGRFVRFGVRGNADVTGMIPAGWGDASGRKLDIEVKREGFDPAKLRGKAREHWERQLARLAKTNANGGYGFWTDSPLYVRKTIALIWSGYRIVIRADGEQIFTLRER